MKTLFLIAALDLVSINIIAADVAFDNGEDR
jgi:hypothetical protein